MKFLKALASYLSFASALVVASGYDCKCTPGEACWPSDEEWSRLNSSLCGALIQSVPPASVCYSDEPNYDEQQCEVVRNQWQNSTWHAQDPISIDYPIWANNSCNPIWPNGTSLTGDRDAGQRGCTLGNYPAFVVNATSAEQISAALKWAGEKNIRIVVKSTGHSQAGRSVGYGSLSIWSHNLRGIEFIDSFKPTSCLINGTLEAVRISAGHSGGEVQFYLSKINKIIVTGANSGVGLIGWLAGGGHGTLSSSYGMGVDNLLEATIVTPTGDIMVTNPCQNPDIFFAIRGGGGGTFGVVTEVVVKAYDSPRTTMHSLGISILSPNTTTEFWELTAFLHKEMPRLKKGGMQGYYYIVGPPARPTLSFAWIFLMYDKPDGYLEGLLNPISSRLHGQSHLFEIQSNSTTATYWEIYSAVFRNEEVGSGGGGIGSWLLTAESLADEARTAEVFERIGPSAVGKNGAFSNPTLIGHMIAPPNTPSYYPDVISLNPAWRDTLVHVIVAESWPDGINQTTIDAVRRDITVNKTQPLRDLSPDTGAYFNEADAFEPNWRTAFWGDEIYGKLKSIKEKYDPENVLWCRRCVGSEALVEQGDGRLCKARYGKRGHGTDFPLEK